jgi:hypothetical protein
MLLANTAHAQQASATGKGIAGGVLLGAEATIITEALFGVESPWIYWSSALGGAAAGGVGGYFVEANAAPRVSFYLLVSGMALVIPTTIFYVDATSARDLPFDSGADRFRGDELDADPPDNQDDLLSKRYRERSPHVRTSSARTNSANTNGARTTAARTSSARTTGARISAMPVGGLVGVSPVGFSLGVPDVECSSVFSKVEVAEFGARQETQFLIPLVRGLF